MKGNGGIEGLKYEKKKKRNWGERRGEEEVGKGEAKGRNESRGKKFNYQGAPRQTILLGGELKFIMMRTQGGFVVEAVFPEI